MLKLVSLQTHKGASRPTESIYFLNLSNYVCKKRYEHILHCLKGLANTLSQTYLIVPWVYSIWATV